MLEIVSQLSKSVFDLIQKERNGRHIDSSAIKPVVDSYRGLECICDEKEGNLNVFQQFFGIPFLRITKVYYLRERNYRKSSRTRRLRAIC
jgi:hypothetical protein